MTVRLTNFEIQEAIIEWLHRRLYNERDYSYSVDVASDLTIPVYVDKLPEKEQKPE